MLCDALEEWAGAVGGKEGDMCIYVADSCCCTVKTSTILQNNCPPIKKKWFRYVTLLLGHIFYQAVSKEEPNWQIWILTSFNFSCPGFGGSVNGQQNAKGKWPEEEQQPGHSASGKMKVHWSLLISESRSCLVSKLGSAEPQMPGIRKELGVSVATQSFV